MLILERFRDRAAPWEGMPRPLQIGLTFVILLVTWVFFRSSDLLSAFQYCGAMVGANGLADNGGLLRGILAQPYYLGTFVAAILATWLLPQAWDWTRSLTWPKAVAVVALFWLSIIVLATQAYNPFIYFIF